MAITTNDELNVLDNKTPMKPRAIPYEKYFGEMDLDEEEIEKRIEMAKSLEKAFLFFFTVVAVEFVLENIIDKEYYYDMVKRKYIDVLASFGIEVEEYPKIGEHIDSVSKDIVDATEPQDPYLTSQDRAMFIAENETNGVRNMVLLDEAIKKGFTKKMWVTKHDRKVRHTHVLVDGVTIGIYDAFHVGDSLMLVPKDDSMGAEAKEIVNCRCVCKFKK